MKKIISTFKYLFNITIIILSQIFSILFPLAWLLRKLEKKNPLWFVLDDLRIDNSRESGFSKDYEIFLINKRETFIKAFKWHVLRNRVYNLVNLFKVEDGNPTTGNQFITIDDLVIDNLYYLDKNNNKIVYKQDGNWVISAGLKYVAKKDQDPWQVNIGLKNVSISKRYSIFGTGYIWYYANKKYYFRYSQCKIVNYIFWKGYRTIELGTNHARYLLSIKHQKIR